MKNALNIDLEDWYHPEFVRKQITGNPKSQIVDSTNQILKLLDKYNVKATFFILGNVAKKNPELIKKIYKKGHEIASHGMSHNPLWELDYSKFDKELKDFKKLIRKILGNNIKIFGFRAPTFSIDNTTKYGIKCLINNQYRYDSSIFPVKTHIYGLKNAPYTIYKPNLNDLSQKDNNSNIIEFPLTILKFSKIKIPISGGFYLRIFPYFILKLLLRRINSKKRPFIIYFHPWETYFKTPKIRNISFRNYFITYYGINNCLKKIESLLQDFEFEPSISIINRNLQEEDSHKRLF